ncbi:MAG: triose-phosphate isomerase [Metamycoplasmataceae bacterium]
MRKIVIIGNWKMNKNQQETKEFFAEIKKINFSLKENLIAGIAVPFINIQEAIKEAPEYLKIVSQDISNKETGAYTGDISANMLDSFKIKYSIIGHSERRQYQHETDAIVNEKAQMALKHGITPIICVGETEDEYEKKLSKEIIKKQLEKGLKGIDLSKIIIAYEPIWAIGTGKTATIEYAQEMCGFIRSLTSEQTIIQYGGSVSPETINNLISQNDIDGALVGGASLLPNSFASLIKK